MGTWKRNMNVLMLRKYLEEDPDGDMEEEHECSDAQEVFDEWILSLTQDHRKMLSVVLLESFRTRQGMSKMNAVQEAASITGSSLPFFIRYNVDFYFSL